jgi:oligopeptide/dipeptide ABC transporter ATP-binding protein
MADALLRFENLSIENPVRGTPLRLVDGIDLQLQRGETLGIVGESGSGKTLTSLTALGLLPTPLRIASGSVVFDGQDLSKLAPARMRSLRGGRIAMIFQDPMTSLNPVMTIGAQIAESVRLHRGLSGKSVETAVIEALERVRIPDPARRAGQYPFEMSGGMRQRAMIALALAGEPDVLLADEPTTALDVTVQAQILALLRTLQQETGMGILFITHDLGVVAQICDRVAVMYAGRIMETASVNALFESPRHPYTRGLLRSLPESTAPGAPLEFIPGQPPVAPGNDLGCPFRDRCSDCLGELCATAAPVRQPSPGRTIRCHLPLEGDASC